MHNQYRYASNAAAPPPLPRNKRERGRRASRATEAVSFSPRLAFASNPSRPGRKEIDVDTRRRVPDQQSAQWELRRYQVVDGSSRKREVFWHFRRNPIVFAKDGLTAQFR